jgi:hypothetical protein
MLWQARLLRFTVFPRRPGGVAPDLEWWREVAGDEPDRINSQPKLGVVDIRGQYGVAQVVLHGEPDRIHWIYAPLEEADPTELLGAFAECLELFEVLLARWFGSERLPVLGRVALGAILRAPVASVEDGYVVLRQMLKSVKIQEGASDFFYQINLPAQVTLDGERQCKVNRLTRWSVAAVETVNAVFGGGLSFGSVPVASDVFAQVEFDINTALDETAEYHAVDLPILFSRFKEVAIRIAEDGEPI